MLAEMWSCTNTHANNRAMGPDTRSTWKVPEGSAKQHCPTMEAVCAAAYLQLGPLHLPLRPLHLEAGPLMPEEVEDPGDVVLSPGRLCSSLGGSHVPAA